MENIRLVIAIVLSLMLFLVWDLVFYDRQEPPPPPPQEETVERKPEKPDSTADDPVVRETKPVLPETTFETITVETDLYKAVISEIGASIQRFDLKEYTEHSGDDSPLKTLIPEENRVGSPVVELPGLEVPLARAAFSTDFSDSVLKIKNSAETLSFFREFNSGMVIEKRYTFYPDTYKIGMSIYIRNESENIFDNSLKISMVNPPPEDTKRFAFVGPFIYIDENLNQIDIDDINDQPSHSGKIQWFGMEDHYFMTALVPDNSLDTTVFLTMDDRNDLLHLTFDQPLDILAPGSTAQHDYYLFFGPKKLSVLRDFGHDLAEIVDFGIFSFLARPALLLMNLIHNNIIANYGVAIIILTLLIKLVFWPLGNKSYRSMAEMRKLQPLMTEIRNKYKDDKKKMNEEVMNLYKTYKVNPVSGCLPMLAQIPFFIAFYRMLYEAIELRHAPFMLWITDLSAPDRLFDFNITIPFMLPPYGIPVLTLIMGITMFLQQKLAPPPGDPMQAKIMMMLPLIFIFIFINFPAGLVLYWLVNNVVSIAQQYNINRKTI